MSREKLLPYLTIHKCLIQYFFAAAAVAATYAIRVICKTFAFCQLDSYAKFNWISFQVNGQKAKRDTDICERPTYGFENGISNELKFVLIVRQYIIILQTKVLGYMCVPCAQYVLTIIFTVLYVFCWVNPFLPFFFSFSCPIFICLWFMELGYLFILSYINV